jgi:hypothetical protein
MKCVQHLSIKKAAKNILEQSRIKNPHPPPPTPPMSKGLNKLYDMFADNQIGLPRVFALILQEYSEFQFQLNIKHKTDYSKEVGINRIGFCRN